MKRQIALVALAAAVIVGATACEPGLSGDSGTDDLPTGGSTRAPTGEAASPPPPPAAAGGVLASGEVHNDGNQLLLEITGLLRQGQTATLSFRITNLASPDYWMVHDNLGSGRNDFTVSGVTLVDPVNAQRYQIARSGGEDGPCACADTWKVNLSEGDSADFFATYAAPPPDISTINVEFPLFGVFTDVPIS